jgi:hypothetical protein
VYGPGAINAKVPVSDSKPFINSEIFDEKTPRMLATADVLETAILAGIHTE